MSSRHPLAPSWLAALLAAGLALGAAAEAAAADPGQSKVVDGLGVYLGVLPARMIARHPKDHPEQAMHGGAPSKERVHHVLAMVLDTASGKRVSGLKIEARVAELGLIGERKTLEPMMIADTATYGNYFELPEPWRYQIMMDIYRPKATEPLHAVFGYVHDM